VAWVWAPNADSHPGGIDVTSWNNWRQYYPGDGYVDWVGIDGYNWGSLDSWQTPTSIFSPVYNDYASHKPIMIAETSSVESGGSKSAWIGQLGSWMTSHHAAAALVWFDTDLSSSGIDWRVDSSTSSFNAFRTLAKSSYFAH
jgi:beta-mannanase